MSLPLEWAYGGLRFAVVDQFPEAEYVSLVRENLSDPHTWEDELAPEVRERHLALSKEIVKSRILRVGAFAGDALVGLAYGRHAGDSTFSMSISLVRPAYRGRGIYTELMRYVLAHTKAEGFLKVVSRHRATNNAVLVPKLKAGFVISGMELDAAFGTMVHLTYFHEPVLREMMERRAGI